MKKSLGPGVCRAGLSQSGQYFFFLPTERGADPVNLDHKDASPSLSPSLTRDNTYVLDVFSRDNTRIYIFYFIF